LPLLLPPLPLLLSALLLTLMLQKLQHLLAVLLLVLLLQPLYALLHVLLLLLLPLLRLLLHQLFPRLQHLSDRIVFLKCLGYCLGFRPPPLLVFLPLLFPVLLHALLQVLLLLRLQALLLVLLLVLLLQVLLFPFLPNLSDRIGFLLFLGLHWRCQRKD
jgi:hypothetical protein